MKAETIAQWVIDNRFPKSENEKITDFEMYHSVLDSIEEHAKDQIEKDRERVKLNAKTKVLSEYEVIVDTKSIDNTPIILD